MPYSWDKPGSSSGSYSWGGGSSKAKKKPAGGSSVLGKIGGFFGNLAGDVTSTSRQIPGGVALAVGAAKYDVTHPLAGTKFSKEPSHVGRDVLKPIAKGYEQTYGPLFHGRFGEFGHTLYKHPLGPILDASVLFTGGAGAVGRVGAAGKAIRAGETGKAVKALATRPVIAPRTLTYRGKSVELEASRNPAARAAQRLLDRAQQRWPDPNIAGRVAFGAVGRVRNLPEKVGFQLGQERRIREAIDRAPAGALVKGTRTLTLPQQVALKVVAEGKAKLPGERGITIDESIAYHRSKIAEGVGSRAGHRREIRLLQLARKYVDESGGSPALRTDIPQAEKLARAYKESHALSQAREALPPVAALGEKVLSGRLSSPGRIVRGARFVREKALSELRGHVREYPGKIKTVRRPRTEAEARSRLAELNASYEALVKKVEDHLTGGQPADKAEVARRNLYNYRSKNRRRGRPRMQTVKQEVRDMAERALYDAAEKHPNDAAARQFTDLVAERHSLQNLLNERALGGQADLGVIEKQVMEPGRRVTKRGRAARPASAKLVGAEDFTGGEFRVPYARRGMAGSLRKHAAAGQSGSIGVPRAPGSLTHSYEGKILESGKMRGRTTVLVAESYIEAHRFTALLRGVDELKGFATDTPQSVHDIPIRLDELKGRAMPEPVREYMERYVEGGHIAAHEADALGLAYESLRKEVFPESVTPGMKGIKYVDKRLLGGLDKPNPLAGVRYHHGGRAVLATVDVINNASRTAILYLKPAYAVPNLLGNVALNITQQGFAAPGNLRRAALANRKLSRLGVVSLDSSMGEGFASALRAEAGIGRKAVNALASGWSAIVDVGFRRAAFFHEARRAGFKTDAQIEDLLTNTAKRETLVKISERANKEIIDYGRLGPLEREIVRRVIFFYPWVKGSSVYAARFLRDHPVQAALLYRLGVLSEAQAQKTLGDRPSFAQALIKVGQRGQNPLASNPASAAILQTPGDLVATVRGLLGGNVDPAAQLASQFTPAVGAIFPALTGRDPFSGFTYPPSRSPSSIYGEQLYGSLPQKVLWERLHKDQSGHLYPYSHRDAWLQFLLGGIAPRPVDLAQLHERAQREQLSREKDIPLGDIRLYRKKKKASSSAYSWGG